MQAPPTRRFAALITATALLLTACGGSSSPPTESGVASLGDTGDSVTGPEADVDPDLGEAGDDEPVAPEDAELAFAAYDDCMADAGFDFGTSIASAGSDEDGAFVQEFEATEGGDPQSASVDALDFGEEFQAADEECSEHLEGLDLSFDMSPEEEAAFEDAQIEWAACMRERGIDVPDFDGGSGAGVIIIGGSEQEGDPQGAGFSLDDFDIEAFEEANEECSAAFAELEERFGGEGRS